MNPNQPLVLQILPSRARQSVFWHFFRKRSHRFTDLYARASLRYAARHSMYDLVPGDLVSDYIAFMGCMEDKLSQRVQALGRRGGLMVDVGANMGYFTLLWAAANPSNRVISIEASPKNVQLLRNNVEKNQFDDRVEVIAKAAGQTEGVLPFSIGPSSQTGWGGLAAERTGQTIDVEVLRLDQLLPRDLHVDFMKIDVEGADAWALMGCERLLRGRQIDEIWFEENKARAAELGIKEGAASEFLRDCGYEPNLMTNPRDAVLEWRANPL